MSRRLGGLQVGEAVDLLVEELGDQVVADVVFAPYLVEEVFVGVDDGAQVGCRDVEDRAGIGAVGWDREVAGEAFDQFPGSAVTAPPRSPMRAASFVAAAPACCATSASSSASR